MSSSDMPHLCLRHWRGNDTIVFSIRTYLSLSYCLHSSLSCSPALETPWTARDLRLLDPLDAPDPALDLIAVYTRSAGLEDHIRLDFLDVPETPAADIFIALDTQPGGNEMAHLSRLDLAALYPEGLVETEIAYDLLLVIPAEGEPGVIDVAEVDTLDPPQSPHRPRPRARHADRGLQPLRPARGLLPAGLRHPRRGARTRRPNRRGFIGRSSRGARQSPDGIFERLRRHHPRSDTSTLGRRAYRSLR